MKCYATGRVSSNSRAAGLVADNGGTISDSYSGSQTTATKGVAGGLVASSSGAIRNCYSTARSPPRPPGRTGGSHHRRAVVSASFWDVQTSGQSASAGGTGKSTPR